MKQETFKDLRRAIRNMTPPHRERLPHPKLFDLIEQGKAGASILYPAWNLLYYSCMCTLEREDENIIVETGTNLGSSTIVLAQTLVETGFKGHVFTFELQPERAAVARERFKEFGVDKLITSTVGSSVDMMPGVLGKRPVRFVFLDSNHGQEHVLGEVKIVHPLVVAAKGKIYFDNTLVRGVDQALRTLRHRYGNSGFVEFRNCSSNPPGNVIWEPVPRTELTPPTHPKKK